MFQTDSIALRLSTQLAVADSLNNWGDAQTINLVVPLTQAAADSLNNWSDSVTVSNDARGISATRADLSNYIRRYLNDVVS